MKTSVLPKTISSIAVFRALQLGDMLCSVPALRALRSAYPRATITLIGLPWAKDFVSRYTDYLDDFLSFPGFPGLPEQEPVIKAFPAFLKEVQERHFDLVIQMQGNGILSNPLVSLFGSNLVAGFTSESSVTPNDKFFVPYPDSGHEIHRLLTLMERLGIPSLGDDLEFPLTDYELDEFELLTEEYEIEPFRYVCIHPGARAADRRWSPQKFARAANHLSARGLKIILTGSPNERELTASIAELLDEDYLDLTGKTSLGVMSCLLAHSRLLVANDTGVSHIASALNVPSVIIFTGSELSRWRPLDPMTHRTINGHQAHAVEQAITSADELLALTPVHNYKIL